VTLPSPAAPPTDLATPGSWAALLGPRWRLWLVVGLLLVFANGVAAPLTDPDLAMHLRIGEWILDHGRLPTVEPFSWTRAGAPFYAYSWLAEVTYLGILRSVGGVGLHVLNGLIAAASVAAVVWFARTVRLSALATVLLALVHLFVTLVAVPSLRPQAVLCFAVPACWAAAARLADPDLPRVRWPYLVLWAAAALAANTHLLAVLCAAPLALLLQPGWRVRTVLAATAAVVVGLLSTPYALEWPAILRLNFAPNPLFRFPSPIQEHTPGMVYMLRYQGMVAALAAALIALPWLAPRPLARGRITEAMLIGLWLAGVLLFGLAARGLLLWWLVVLPITGLALGRLPGLTDSLVARAIRVAPFAGVALIAGSRAVTFRDLYSKETTVARRTAAFPLAQAAVLLADSLDRAAPGGHGRVLTVFNYGNVLLWRLPGYQTSLDGRTIFPDSASLQDGYVLAPELPDSLPSVIGSAEVAILPLDHTMQRRVSRAPGWRRLAVARTPEDSAALWVRDGWLQRYGARRMP
jgi:hypothetical protein